MDEIKENSIEQLVIKDLVIKYKKLDLKMSILEKINNEKEIQKFKINFPSII